MYVAPSESSLVSAVSWVEQVLAGSVATGCAVLAMAGIGYQLLNGRIDQRRAARVVIGIFILFGAPALVHEIVGSLRGDSVAAPDPAALQAGPPPAPKAGPRADPFAGASVPME